MIINSFNNSFQIYLYVSINLVSILHWRIAENNWVSYILYSLFGP